MKKIISLLLVTLILCFSFGAVSVSAGVYNGWVLGPDAEYLTHDGDIYYPVYSDQLYYSGYGNFVELKFADEETAEKYEGSTVEISVVKTNYFVLVSLDYAIDYSYLDVIYVREDYLEEYRKIASGEAENYSVEYNWYNEQSFDISKEQMDSWLQGKDVTVPANSIYKYSHRSVEGICAGGLLRFEHSKILWDTDTNEVYLLLNSNLDHNKTYSPDDTFTLYKLEDEDVRARLVEYISYVPEDELEWMNPGEPDYTTLYILAGTFFGFIPFALLAFSVVMFFVTKHKNYRRGFVLMGAGSLLILIAALLMLLMLL